MLNLTPRINPSLVAHHSIWRKVRESNPQELSLRQFSGLFGVPVPNLPRDASGGIRTPMLAKSDGFTGRLPDRFGV